MKEGCAEDAVQKSSEKVGLGEALQILFWSSLCCSRLALPSSLCLQNVLWDFGCLSLAVCVVISDCSHSIFNMFPVGGFQLRRLVVPKEC